LIVWQRSPFTAFKSPDIVVILAHSLSPVYSYGYKTTGGSYTDFRKNLEKIF
jgi:hypothetical protein